MSFYTDLSVLFNRFPIIDCRPISDIDHNDWSRQKIHSDFFQIEYIQFRFSVMPSGIQIVGNELNGFYYENASSSKVHFAKASLSTENGIHYPKLTLEFPTDQELESNIETISQSIELNSQDGTIDTCELLKVKSNVTLPFSYNRHYVQDKVEGKFFQIFF